MRFGLCLSPAFCLPDGKENPGKIAKCHVFHRVHKPLRRLLSSLTETEKVIRLRKRLWHGCLVRSCLLTAGHTLFSCNNKWMGSSENRMKEEMVICLTILTFLEWRRSLPGAVMKKSHYILIFKKTFPLKEPAAYVGLLISNHI